MAATAEQAKAECIEALKERLWKEVWKEEIDLPVKSVVEREVDGGVEVTVEV